MAERLQKLISRAGIASRRAAEDMIRQGQVTLNGRVAQLGDKADLSQDVVTVNGRTLEADPDLTYILLYKPPGVICSNKRQDKRRIVRDLVPHKGHLFTVGRLDADSEGVILLTNDGELANKLMHPRYEHTKTYRVKVTGRPTRQTLEQWRQGVLLDGKRTAPAKVRVLDDSRQGHTWLQLVMREGRKRQIRRVARLLGHHVEAIIRVKIDMLAIGHMQPGEWRHLTPKEVRTLKHGK
jgi:23S rRNA pseudouridine2605 synthase